jgi:hypothetical protein
MDHTQLRFSNEARANEEKRTAAAPPMSELG